MNRRTTGIPQQSGKRGRDDIVGVGGRQKGPRRETVDDDQDIPSDDSVQTTRTMRGGALSLRRAPTMEEQLKRMLNFIRDPASPRVVIWPTMDLAPRVPQQTKLFTKVTVGAVLEYYAFPVPINLVSPDTNSQYAPTPTLTTLPSRSPLPFYNKGFTMNPLDRAYGQALRTYVEVGPQTPIGWGEQIPPNFGGVTGVYTGTPGVTPGSAQPFALIFGFNSQQALSGVSWSVMSSFDNQVTVGGMIPNQSGVQYGAYYTSFHPRLAGPAFLPLLDPAYPGLATPDISKITKVGRCTATRLEQVVCGTGTSIIESSGNQLAFYTPNYHDFPIKKLLTDWNEGLLYGLAWAPSMISPVVKGDEPIYAYRGLDVKSELRSTERPWYTYAQWEGFITPQWQPSNSQGLLPANYETVISVAGRGSTEGIVGIQCPAYVEIQMDNNWTLSVYNAASVGNGEPFNNNWGTSVGYPSPAIFSPNTVGSSMGNKINMMKPLPPFEYPQWRLTAIATLGFSWANYGDNIIPPIPTTPTPMIGLPWSLQTASEFNFPHPGPGSNPLVMNIIVVDVWAAVQVGATMQGVGAQWSNNSTQAGAYVSGLGPRPPGKTITRQVHRTLSIVDGTKMGYPLSVPQPTVNLTSNLSPSQYGPYGPTGWQAETGQDWKTWYKGSDLNQYAHQVRVQTGPSSPMYTAPGIADGVVNQLDTPEYTEGQIAHVAGMQHIQSFLMVTTPNVAIVGLEAKVQQSGACLFGFFSGGIPNQTVSATLNTCVEVQPGPEIQNYMDRHPCGPEDAQVEVGTLHHLSRMVATGDLRYAEPEDKERIREHRDY